MNPDVVIIAAVAEDWAIGRKGQLLAHVKGDLPRFKRLTMGHPVIMGRKTYESFPKRPLPGRLNIVITRQTDYPVEEGMCVATSLDEALRIGRRAQAGDIFVIGGGEIYRQAFPIADRLEITLLSASYPDADTFFPVIGDEWNAIAWEQNPGSEPPSEFITLKR